MAHGTTLYDELIHVPMVIKPPASWKIAPGAALDALVEHRDLLPTFLEAAGKTPADERSQQPAPAHAGRRLRRA